MAQKPIRIDEKKRSTKIDFLCPATASPRSSLSFCGKGKAWMKDSFLKIDFSIYVNERSYSMKLISSSTKSLYYSSNRPWTNLSFFSQLEYIGLKSSWPKRPRKSSKVCPRPRNAPSYTYRLCLFSRSSSVCQYYQLVPDGALKFYDTQGGRLYFFEGLLSFPTEKMLSLPSRLPRMKGKRSSLVETSY